MKNTKRKRLNQLGMTSGKASGILKKMIIFDFVKKSGIKCYRCGGELTLDTLSVEHKEPYLDSENPKEKFFDLDNVTFSHFKCNSANTRNTKIRLPNDDGNINCSKCGLDKDKSNFIKSRKSDGYKGNCKECRREKRRSRRSGRKNNKKGSTKSCKEI